MNYYICNFRKDWADEFDVVGSDLFTEDQKKEFEDLIEKHSDEVVSIGFGTNEGWEDETVSEFADAYKFVEITEETYKELKSKFPNGFGIFVDIGDHLAYMNH